MYRIRVCTDRGSATCLAVAGMHSGTSPCRWAFRVERIPFTHEPEHVFQIQQIGIVVLQDASAHRDNMLRIMWLTCWFLDGTGYSITEHELRFHSIARKVGPPRFKRPIADYFRLHRSRKPVPKRFSEEGRQHIIRNRRKGVPASRITRDLDVSARHVRRLWARHQKIGGTRLRMGRPRDYVTESQIRLVTEAYREQPVGAVHVARDLRKNHDISYDRRQKGQDGRHGSKGLKYWNHTRRACPGDHGGPTVQLCRVKRRRGCHRVHRREPRILQPEKQAPDSQPQSGRVRPRRSPCRRDGVVLGSGQAPLPRHVPPHGTQAHSPLHDRGIRQAQPDLKRRARRRGQDGHGRPSHGGQAAHIQAADSRKHAVRRIGPGPRRSAHL